jgi:hypothetical protein
MKMRALSVALLMCIGSANLARADPYTVLPSGELAFNVVLTTSGVFTCLRGIPCTGSGSNSITVGTGAETATISFLGVTNKSFRASAVNVPVFLGLFDASSSPGFTWPSYSNRNVPVLQFDLRLSHAPDMPLAATGGQSWGFGPGGGTSLPVLNSIPPGGGGNALLPLGANPPGFAYTAIAYTFTPYPFSLPSNGSLALSANVGAVPEPGTMVLLGLSLAGAAYARRRQRRIHDV